MIKVLLGGSGVKAQERSNVLGCKSNPTTSDQTNLIIAVNVLVSSPSVSILTMQTVLQADKISFVVSHHLPKNLGQ